MNYRKLGNLAGWLVFAIATIVYYFSVERTGSLWDCGEFVSGAYKLQVVHPPGAPMFLIIGRMFALVGEMIYGAGSEGIAFTVNFLSGVCTAFAAAFFAWSTFMIGKYLMVGRSEEVSQEQSVALAFAALVAGLGVAFSTSVWFSAVEGEVYAMSTFFTGLTVWAATKWFYLPNEPEHDRWLIFSIFAIGLSVGVHLLSILVFPLITLLYYFKKYEKHDLRGFLAASFAGLFLLFFTQSLVIIGIPKIWGAFELFMVNSLGLPQHSGLIPTLAIIGALIYFGLRYAHRNKHGFAQKLIVAASLIVIGFSTIGVVLTRSNAGTPINMNEPTNALRLIPYLNREQYGDRPLLRGPQFDAEIVDTESSDRYDYVEKKGKYEVVDQKLDYVYKDSDKTLFPRMADRTQGRPGIYRREWMNGRSGSPSFTDNIRFFLGYQVGWMYWRYFMWNFAGRQNGTQGFSPGNSSDGNWLSGIKPLDEARLHNMDKLTDDMKNHRARNTYYMLPFLFGLLGVFFHYSKDKKTFLAYLALFAITGLGIIVQSNQPPREPRERDYVLVGSFMTYCMWMGLGVLALYEILKERANLKGIVPAALAGLIVLVAPVLMGTQNFDDHSRRLHKGARDYATNFLESVAPNAILFTYGDNDTYPLWYAQEVEGIRTDVRVINLSLIAVDWYINQARRRINDSPPIKLTISEEAYRGRQRIQVPVAPFKNKNRGAMNALDAVRFVGEDHSAELGGRLESYLPSNKLFLPVDKSLPLEKMGLSPADADRIPDRVEFTIPGNNIYKGDLAVLDIIASNLWERPIYFAVTSRDKALIGLQDYTQLEGLALRVVPIKSNSQSPYGMVGLGRVAIDSAFHNITREWQWGNFDKVETFIDHSYGPSVQSMQFAMLRLAEALLNKQDKQRAIEVADTYFEAFPHFNFPYNFNTLSMIRVYVAADAYDKAKPRLETLAEQTRQELEFYSSLSRDDMKDFQQEIRFANNTMNQMMQVVKEAKDSELEANLQEMFAQYQQPDNPLKG